MSSSWLQLDCCGGREGRGCSAVPGSEQRPLSRAPPRPATRPRHLCTASLTASYSYYSVFPCNADGLSPTATPASLAVSVSCYLTACLPGCLTSPAQPRLSRQAEVSPATAAAAGPPPAQPAPLIGPSPSPPARSLSPALPRPKPAPSYVA